MARVAHQMAFDNPNITADVVEATEFPQLVQRYQVSAVPKTVINERIEIIGAVPEAQFLGEVMKTQAT